MPSYEPPVSTTNFALTTGNADAYVSIKGGALAMAHSATGGATAYTDGFTATIQEEGTGRAGVSGGTVWATAGKKNKAAAHSGRAQHLAELESGAGRYMTVTHSWKPQSRADLEERKALRRLEWEAQASKKELRIASAKRMARAKKARSGRRT